VTGPAPTDVDPASYWERQHQASTLRAVGQAGLPEELNRWLYKIGRRNVQAFLARNGIRTLDGLEVFDVGSGTGYWATTWLELGASRVDGCDFVPDAVDRLREQFPDATFSLGDIAEPGTIPADRAYPFVTTMNVMLHILDDERFAAAATNIAGAVAPGGHLLLAEPALQLAASVMPRKPGAASIARPLEQYRAPFEAAGLELVDVGASTVVAANPIERGLPDYGKRARRWSAVGRWARRGPRWASATGGVLSIADRVLMRSGQAPSGKLILFRRPRP
jgi:SAM-dependent methyltransferase